MKGIDSFYECKKRLQVDTPAQSHSQNVDRAFQQRVWSWLAQDPLVRIGENDEGTSLSLDEIEALDVEEKPLRLFTTKQQIWITLTGHERDTRKVPAKSFQLLQIIAAHRVQGITQPELVRISDQDKRSVPQRTAKLAEAGHIKKLPVLANHSNTSLLIHSKFFDEFAIPAAGEQIIASLTSESAPDRLFLGHNRHTRVEKQLREAIDVLANNNNLLMWSDLKKKTNVNDPVTSKLLAEGMRRLEELGVTARVRASATDERYNVTTSLHRCVQLLRPPTESDWHTLFDWTRQEENNSVVETAHVNQSQEEVVSSGEAEVNDESANAELLIDHDTQDLHIPTWSPDRLLTHTVRSALLLAGTTGLSTKDLKRFVTGPFYIRPVDRFLDRCVWRWQRTQPLHLRHLAIVRDSAQLGKTSFYVHFVHDAFGVKVDNQETFWEAVQSYPDTNEAVVRDQYGFTPVPAARFVGKKNDMTLRQAVLESGITCPVLMFGKVLSENIPKTIKTAREKVRYASKKSKFSPLEDTPNLINVMATPVGRPRKYPTAGTVLDFSTMTADAVRKAVTSQQRAQEYVRKKARKQVEELVTEGIPRDEAEEAVLTELDLSAEAYERNTIMWPAEFKEVKRSTTKKRKREKPRYLPSIHAHTIPLYTAIEPEEPQPKRQKRTTRQTTERKQKSIALGYLPSVLAHTQPLFRPLPLENAIQNADDDPISTENPITPSGEIVELKSPSRVQDSIVGLDSSATVSDKLIDSLQKDNNRQSSVGKAVKNMDPQLINSARFIEVQASSAIEGSVLEDSEIPLPSRGGAEGQPVNDDSARSLRSRASLKRKASGTDLADLLTVKKRPTIGDSQDVLEDTTSTDRMDTTTGNDTTIVADEILPEAPAVTIEAPPSPTRPIIIPSATSTTKSRAPRMTPFGGTIAAMRKLIILGIVRDCGGAFPGDGELVYPFLTAYAKKFPDARPDNKTIKVAKTMLVGEGKLKQIFFTCKSPSGLVQSKSIIALPDIVDIDQRIQDLQKAMAKIHPHPYFPPGTDIKPDLIPRAASYNASGLAILRQGPYSNDLPIISDLVVPHYPWKSIGKSSQKVSNDTNDDADTVDDPTSPAKPKKRMRKSTISKGDHLGDVGERNKSPDHTIEGSLPISPDESGIISVTGGILHLNDEEQPVNEPKSKRQRRAAPKSGQADVEDAVAIQTTDEQDPTEISSQKRVAFADLPEQPKRKRRRNSKIALAAEIQEDENGMTNDASSPEDNGGVLQDETDRTRTRSRTSQAQTRFKKSTHPSFKSKPVFFPFKETSQQATPDLNPGSSLTTTHSLPSGQENTPSELFSSMADDVVRWEIAQPEAFKESSRNVFINYPFIGNHQRYIRSEKDEAEKKVVAKNVIPRPRRKQNSEKQVPDISTQPNPPKVNTSFQTPSGQKLSALEVLAQKGEKTPGVRYSKTKDNRPRQIDARRAKYQWDQDDDRKLLIASCFGHIALGGVREENHWGIVSRMLDHKYGRELCRRRWGAVKTKHRNDLELIASELRTALLDAYETGDAPELNFTNFWDNDWTGILKWAVDKIDNPRVEDVELPATREAFEATFFLQEFPQHESPDFLESKRIASGPVRHSVLNAGNRVLQDDEEHYQPELDLARTFIRANILTPKDSYKSAEAKAKLQQFPETIIDKVVNELLTDRVISQACKGRVSPKRTYDVSAHFLKAMSWKLSVPHFKYATAFKEILDEKFTDDGKIEYKPAFGNGEMITLLNLLADNTIKITGQNIPNKKFGLTTNGYKTRSMDKKIFNFDVFLEPSKTYSYGLPSRPLPSPPLSIKSPIGQAIEDRRIPLWVDINGAFLPIMWDLAVGAVGNALVVDTAADAKHIAERIKPCVAEFEVQLILEWLVEAGVAIWKDDRHDVIELTTYWWSVITTPISKVGSSEEAVMLAGVQLQ